MPVEHGAEGGRPATVAAGSDRRAELVWPHESELVSFVDRGLELSRGDERGKVDDGLERIGDGDAQVPDHVRGRAAMHGDPRPALDHVRGHGNVHPVGSTRRADAPQRRGARVAERRIRPTGQDGGHPAPVLGEIRAPDRVHAAPHGMQSPVGDPVGDRLGAEAEREELAPRDHAVLPTDEIPDLRGHLLKPRVPHRGYKASAGRSSPPRAGVLPGGTGDHLAIRRS